MKNQATTTAKPTINAIAAQAGAISITVQTGAIAKPSAKKIKELAPLVSAMNIVGENTSAELLARLPTTTIAYKCFSSQVLGTSLMFAWFDENQTRLTRTTKDGKILLDMAGAYVSAFGISHNKTNDGPLKGYPFYKRFSNALQQWAKKRGGFEKRASGAISDAIAAYLDKKQHEDSQALSDSVVAWVLKHEEILNRIINSKAV